MDVVKIEGMANTYVVFDEETKLALAIDPSYNGHKVEQFCKEEGLTLGEECRFQPLRRIS